MSTILGIMSHRKLMELKNCGVVKPELFEDWAEEKFRQFRVLIADNLQDLNKGFCLRYLGMYTRKTAEMEAGLMFSDRRELLEHMIIMEGESRFLSVAKGELDEFTLIHQASLAASKAEKVLLCFKYSDQVLVDDETGYHVTWLLKNAELLRGLLEKRGEQP